MKLTKLEMISLGNIASDIRRSANKLTRIAWNEHEDNTREYQQTNVRNVINDIQEIIITLKQMEKVLILELT